MSGPYRARDVAGYIVGLKTHQRDSLTPLQLMKVVFLCHGWMLGRYGRPLVSDSFDTWRYGPVSPDLYAALKKFGSSVVTEVPGAKPIDPDQEEREVIDVVSAYYARFDGIRLSALTHAPGSPWEAMNKTAGQNESIPNDLIENYYSSIARHSAAKHTRRTPDAQLEEA